jgi:hypothetical protein
MFYLKLAVEQFKLIVRNVAVLLRRPVGVRKSAVRIVRPPGFLLHKMSQWLLTRHAHKMYVEPVIADMQHEYCEAFYTGQKWMARWIAVRGYLLVLPSWIYASLTRAQGIFRSYRL